MYDFRGLSSLDFEELVRDLLQEETKIRFESFGSGPDLGIDFRFATGTGSAVVQVKHYVQSGPSALVQAAEQEYLKVLKLKPERYIFATSVRMDPVLKAKIRGKFPGIPLVDEDVIGQEDLNNLLIRHPSIERKHFKLWLASSVVLERVLHSGVYNRTEAELVSIKKFVPKFVYNNSVLDAERILQSQGSLVISGEPGVGKSTLARILVLLHVERGWKISVIDEVREAFEVAHGDEPHLIFFDDFLGKCACRMNS